MRKPHGAKVAALMEDPFQERAPGGTPFPVHYRHLQVHYSWVSIGHYPPRKNLQNASQNLEVLIVLGAPRKGSEGPTPNYSPRLLVG